MIDLTGSEPVAPAESEWARVVREELAALRVFVDAIGTEQIAVLRAERAVLEEQVASLRAEVTLDEVGLRFHGPSLHGALAELRTKIEHMAAEGLAITKPPFEDPMGVEDNLAKIVLRAYNAEAELLVRTVRIDDLSLSVAQLRDAYETISRMATCMGLGIAPDYHRARVEELQLTAQARAASSEIAQRNEDEEALRELRAVKSRLSTEYRHYEQVRRDTDVATAAAAATRLTSLAESLRRVAERESELRARLAAVEDASTSVPLQIARDRLRDSASPSRGGRSRARWLGTPFHRDAG